MVPKHLPSDLVFEILTRISSSKTLDSCRLVCKEGRQLTNDLRFMSTNGERTKDVDGYFIQSSTFDLFKWEYSSKFVSTIQSQGATAASDYIDFNTSKHGVQILASCNQGILCCKRNKKYYVCKPATGQWQLLPDPKTSYGTFFGIMVVNSVDSCLRYKIVKLFNYQIFSTGCSRPEVEYNKVEVEIFDSESWAWSQKKHLLLPSKEFITPNPAIFINNYFYWLTEHENVLVYCPITCSLKRKFPLPEQRKNKPGINRLCEYKGKLGFTRIASKCLMEFWVKTDHGKDDNWMKIFMVNMENICKYFLDAHLHSYNAEIIYLGIRDIRDRKYSVTYNIRDCMFSVAELKEAQSDEYEIFQFRSDLEFVNLKPEGNSKRRRKLCKKSIRGLLREVLLDRF